MWACATLGPDGLGCGNDPVWRRHDGPGPCHTHRHDLYCDEHARTFARYEDCTPASNIEGIYGRGDSPHPRQRRVAPRGE